MKTLQVFYIRTSEPTVNRQIIMLAVDEEDARALVLKRYPETEDVWTVTEYEGPFDRGRILYEDKREANGDYR